MKFFILLFVAAFCYSCAPVKFARSNTITVDPNVNPSSNSVTCTPKINGTLDTFTYSSSTPLPRITSSCNFSDLTFQWIVKKPDASVITSTIPGLDPVANPENIDFQGLGAGIYYVFLEARSSAGSKTPFIAATPLEFIVPGPGIGNSLICDPKLNGTFMSVSVGDNDPNPQVKANCVPQAAMYLWEVKKTGLTTPVQVPGLSTESQTPNFKSLGTGEYKITLYATAPNSGAWRSSTPLVVTVTGTSTMPPVDCTPRINGTLTEITLTSVSPKPLFSANCNPSDVVYNWGVTKGGATVNVPSLAGANSNPDFSNLGVGTYIITLNASKTGMNPWNSSKPLVVTVDSGAGGGMTIQCSPRLNGQSVAMTILTTGPNPSVTANCLPAGVNYSWVVTRGGQRVDMPSLSGASSVPMIAQAGQGTYLLFLTATLTGYNSYVSPSPLEVTVAPVMSPTRKVIYSKDVKYTDNKVDILMVVDDSNSMYQDNARLAQRMNEFVNDLSLVGIDWQVCTTITRAKANAEGKLEWGPSIIWAGQTQDPRWVLKKNIVPNPNEKFIQTMINIGAGIEGSDDERGIKAALNHVSYSKWWADGVDYSKCNRPDASLAVILISDEDERSIGGDQSLVYYPSDANKPLEPEDLPQSYINKVKETLGADKRFTFNSIIVRPNDKACMDAQDADGDAKSHYGYKYDELSKATGGHVGSICDSDYKSNLNLFKDRIVNSLASVPLECAPVGQVKVTITPSMGEVASEIRNNSNTLVFTPAIRAERRLELEYYCPMN